MISSFPPITSPNAQILILGTMPGAMSLQQQEYYAHKQNQFWKILFTVFSDGIVPENFEFKVQLIKENRIVLWDVLANCEREGSLDVNIKNHQENDIPGLLQEFPGIRKILFNGKESHRYFMKKFGNLDGIEFHVMPSTSPANTVKFEEKLKSWCEALI
ncbi:DNA-deoxyinosine glycosylase [Flavobacterium sp. CYK-4]|uniref:DNA-deoxyinosine glycosylase n=1 Tax=Flavobacterium lotistagni TaxID=2709660 RepID=UPI00140DDD5C|nr:DNA-deoxyinosine glycosylase [Flavobacterium lotistagni]NHM07467.1 DNA-deoxyinosine glycosylase [Flavobacterium lotistagni]